MAVQLDFLACHVRDSPTRRGGNGHVVRMATRPFAEDPWATWATPQSPVWRAASAAALARAQREPAWRRACDAMHRSLSLAVKQAAFASWRSALALAKTECNGRPPATALRALQSPARCARVVGTGGSSGFADVREERVRGLEEQVSRIRQELESMRGSQRRQALQEAARDLGTERARCHQLENVVTQLVGIAACMTNLTGPAAAQPATASASLKLSTGDAVDAASSSSTADTESRVADLRGSLREILQEISSRKVRPFTEQNVEELSRLAGYGHQLPVGALQHGNGQMDIYK